MTTMLERALQLLGRPVAIPGDAPPGDAEKPHRKAGTPAAPGPVTEAELLAALSQLADERVAAERLLSGAADRRETLLMQPGSDDEILSLGQDIDRANLLLERLDRIEPDLRRKLGEVRFHDRNRRWIADRDAAADAFATFTAAIDAYETARAEWVPIWNELCARWPDVHEIAPRMPQLTGSSADYEQRLASFREKVRVLAAPPPPVYHTLSNAIDYAKRFGQLPDGIPGEWQADVERAIDGEVSVTTLVGTTGADGHPIPKGPR